MSGHFKIEVDTVRNMIRVKLAGMLGADEVRAFLAERAAAHRRLTCGANRHRSLADIRELKIQTQESVAAFRSVLADKAYHSHRLAFVAAPTLARSQMMRALGSRDARCFETVEAAEAWLMAEPGRADASSAPTRPQPGQAPADQGRSKKSTAPLSSL